MPFKSKAQRRKFAELLVNGKITDEQYEEWNRSTGKKDLPERVKPKKKATKKVATTRRKAKAAAPRSRTRRARAGSGGTAKGSRSSARRGKAAARKR
jgi:hypothetical protein